MTTLLEQARTLESELADVRRDLHRNPELAFRETRTSAKIAARLEELDYRVTTGIARTGVYADLDNGDGPMVALRADMDALPMREQNDVPYRSEIDGIMHACGHDAHVAMLLGAARLLHDARAAGELPPGSVRLLFQPAEEAADKENKSGARRMVDEGALAGVSAIFGLRVAAHLPPGHVYVRAGVLLAGSDAFSALIEGRSAHAGRPHQGLDAIALAAHVVVACQNAVARRLAAQDSGVLSIGIVRGGVAGNVIADRVAMRGTIRYVDERTRGTLHRELRNAFAVADALGGKVNLEVRPGYPPLHNSSDMTETVRATTKEVLGEDALGSAEIDMTADDFALYLAEVPGCCFWLGAALDPPRETHHPRFDIDESALAPGAAVLAGCAMRALTDLA